MAMPLWNEPDAETQFAELLRDVEDRMRMNGSVPTAAREAGQFLNVMAKAMRVRNVIEVGTDDGYATLWLAEAVYSNDGTITSIESNVWRLETVRETLMRSPHAGSIRLMQGDPRELLSVLAGPFDFVLLGGDERETLHYFRLLFEQVASGSVICCDRAISRAGALADYLTYVHSNPGLESILVPVGEGIEVTYKLP